jgi:hypothetical protein
MKQNSPFRLKSLAALAFAAMIASASASFAQNKPAAPGGPQGGPPAQQEQQPAPPVKPTPQQTAADVQSIHACINIKSPEGDLPPEGPARDKVMQEAEGGPQACVGTIIEACQKAGGSEETCMLREATAWLASTTIDKATETKFGAKNAGVYKAASSKIMANAVALCRAAASVSNWGADAIKTNSKELVFDVMQPCVFDAIVQQSLIILVNKRG